ncbi:MAG: helix-turn-helix domain-containing protein [Bacteroidales bacterium]|jgi:excisionase family DNA binding protein|nr:helix-turn-helix domain-containing protein [Bacteroidales bacterium]
MTSLTFDRLPEAVTMLISEVSEIKQLLIEQQPLPPEPTERFLTIQEAAEFLNLTVPTLYSKVHKRQIPVMKQGKRLYFSSTELMEYLKAGRKKTNAEIELEAEAYLLNKKKGGNNE